MFGRASVVGVERVYNCNIKYNKYSASNMKLIDIKEIIINM